MTASDAPLSPFPTRAGRAGKKVPKRVRFHFRVDLPPFPHPSGRPNFKADLPFEVKMGRVCLNDREKSALHAQRPDLNHREAPTVDAPLSVYSDPNNADLWESVSEELAKEQHLVNPETLVAVAEWGETLAPVIFLAATCSSVGLQNMASTAGVLVSALVAAACFSRDHTNVQALS